jgi:uncharacterized membrane protein YkvA (DUF1232 family)
MMGKITQAGKAHTLHTGFHLVRNWKTMRCMFKDAWKGNYTISGMTKVALFLGIVYVLLPFDFDWVPVLGWLDDGLIIFLLIKRLQVETTRYVRAKAIARKSEC